MPPENSRVVYQHQLQKGPRARRKPPASGRPELTIPQILVWADDFHLRTGQWPKPDSGAVSRLVDDTWSAVNAALYYGSRGLPKGSSLSRLLAEKRGVPNRTDLSKPAACINCSSKASMFVPFGEPGA